MRVRTSSPHDEMPREAIWKHLKHGCGVSKQVHRLILPSTSRRGTEDEALGLETRAQKTEPFLVFIQLPHPMDLSHRIERGKYSHGRDARLRPIKIFQILLVDAFVYEHRG
jgi:hypothetical protein